MGWSARLLIAPRPAGRSSADDGRGISRLVTESNTARSACSEIGLLCLCRFVRFGVDRAGAWPGHLRKRVFHVKHARHRSIPHREGPPDRCDPVGGCGVRRRGSERQCGVLSGSRHQRTRVIHGNARGPLPWMWRAKTRSADAAVSRSGPLVGSIESVPRDFTSILAEFERPRRRTLPARSCTSGGGARSPPACRDLWPAIGRMFHVKHTCPEELQGMAEKVDPRGSLVCSAPNARARDVTRHVSPDTFRDPFTWISCSRACSGPPATVGSLPRGCFT